MKTGNKIGIGGVIALVLAAAGVLSQSSYYPYRWLVFVSMFLEVGSLILLIVAGIKGSRWWFAVPVVFIGAWILIMSGGR